VLRSGLSRSSLTAYGLRAPADEIGSLGGRVLDSLMRAALCLATPRTLEGVNKERKEGTKRSTESTSVSLILLLRDFCVFVATLSAGRQAAKRRMQADMSASQNFF
jgi:hypothetical protein